MIQIEKCVSLADLNPLKEDWDELLKRNDVREIFLTFEWFQSWIEADAEDEIPLILIGRRNGKICGIAPLARRIRRRMGRECRSIGFLGFGDYCDFISESDCKGEFVLRILEYLLKKEKKWDFLELQNVPETSKTVEAIKKINDESGMGIKMIKDLACPTMQIKEDGNFARDCLRKKSLVRHYNYFRRNGDLKFVNSKDRNEIKSHLGNFFAQHIKRRELAGDGSLFSIANRRRFYNNLTDTMPVEWLDFSFLEFNNSIISYHFGFFYNKKLIWYKPSFDVQFAEHSPGEVHLRFLIDQAVEMGAEELDFTIGDEEFKRRFSNMTRHTYKMEYIKSSWLKGYWVLGAMVKKVAGRISPEPIKKIFKTA
jgi:CelD/BcsL family acetyltransferase involved in cellulose biosynthesis